MIEECLILLVRLAKYVFRRLGGVNIASAPGGTPLIGIDGRHALPVVDEILGHMLRVAAKPMMATWRVTLHADVNSVDFRKFHLSDTSAPRKQEGHVV